ncbi:MAG: hypothetical protein IKT32_01310, partial [Clostridia bacterium]|nr:hypothetical protein [Clostridia bacterium]
KACADSAGAQLSFTHDSQIADHMAPFKYEERGENKPHPSALEVCKIAKKYGSKIVISHLFPDCDNSALKEECFAEYDNCIFAVQGEKYSI